MSIRQEENFQGRTQTPTLPGPFEGLGRAFGPEDEPSVPKKTASPNKPWKLCRSVGVTLQMPVSRCRDLTLLEGVSR